MRTRKAQHYIDKSLKKKQKRSLEEAQATVDRIESKGWKAFAVKENVLNQED